MRFTDRLWVTALSSVFVLCRLYDISASKNQGYLLQLLPWVSEYFEIGLEDLLKFSTNGCSLKMQIGPRSPFPKADLLYRRVENGGICQIKPLALDAAILMPKVSVNSQQGLINDIMRTILIISNFSENGVRKSFTSRFKIKAIRTKTHLTI